MSQVSSNTGKNLSIAALVCGILGIVGGFIPVVQYFTTVLSILAIIFGVMGRKRMGGKSAWPRRAWCWASSRWPSPCWASSAWSARWAAWPAMGAAA